VTPTPAGDTDGDGVANVADNCANDFNPGQENADAYYDNGPNLAGLDDTVPGGDALGDACDSDDDNDGLADADDGQVLGACGTFDGTGAGHAQPVGGDYTITDGNGASWDTDNDQVPDAVECGAGTNPRAGSVADRLACANDVGGAPDDNTDMDGLLDLWEVCKWNTDPGSDDTDGDAAGDCTEALDLNGNGVVNDADAVFVYQMSFGIITGDWTFDINGNGVVNSADGVRIRQAFFGIRPCV
jgi:hypothetical protein